MTLAQLPCWHSTLGLSDGWRRAGTNRLGIYGNGHSQMAGRNYKPKIDVADVVASFLVDATRLQWMLADPASADVAHSSRSSDMWAGAYSFINVDNDAYVPSHPA